MLQPITFRCWKKKKCTYTFIVQDQVEDLLSLRQTLEGEGERVEWAFRTSLHESHIPMDCLIALCLVLCVLTGWLMWNLVGILLRMAESKS